MTDAKLIDACTLRALYRYDTETGVFSRVGSNRPRIGNLSRPGRYWRVRIFGKQYMVHRLAWLYVTGHWPDGEIDHINGVRTDNRFKNLRDVDHRTNGQNIRSGRGVSGLLGVSPIPTGFRADLRINGKPTCLGVFKTPDEAHAAYVAAKRIHHYGCTL